MNTDSLVSTDKKLEQVKSALTPSQWNDPGYLQTIARDNENNDLPLAFRLWQRVHNLSPENEEIGKHLAELAKTLDKTHPEMMHTSSSEREAQGFAPSLTRHFDRWAQTINRFSSFQLVVVVPWLLFAAYLVLWASPRFESESRLIIKQPDSMSIADPSALLLSGVGLSSGNNDSELVAAYIRSYDMLAYLDENLSLREHYSSSEHADYFSRLSSWSSQEDFLDFYLSKVEVNIDPASMVISLKTQAFTEHFARQLNETIIGRAEWFINNVNQELASAQLSFMNQEHKRSENSLAQAKQTLLQFQEQYNLLDPTSEGMALQQIAFNLEAMLSQKRAELSAFRQVMSDNAPEVSAIKREIQALEGQLEEEKKRLTPSGSTSSPDSIAGIMAKFSELRVQLEIATQAYTASLISLEKNRIETTRQLQYLVTIQTPTLAEDSTYPKVSYSLTFLAAVLFMLYAIGKIIVATIRELG